MWEARGSATEAQRHAVAFADDAHAVLSFLLSRAGGPAERMRVLIDQVVPVVRPDDYVCWTPEIASSTRPAHETRILRTRLMESPACEILIKKIASHSLASIDIVIKIMDGEHSSKF